jgi:hypothetical protein
VPESGSSQNTDQEELFLNFDKKNTEIKGEKRKENAKIRGEVRKT